MNHEFAHILGSSRWLMEPKAFRAMVKRAETATPEAIHAAVQAYADRPPSLNMLGDVAVIPMCGPITYKRSWFSMFFGGATIEDMQTQFRLALRDDSVKSIAFRCDSGGGEVTMIPEFADEIFAARGQKPIAAVVDSCMCSAALWLGAQADAIYVSSSSMVGSVGVYLEVEDVSEMLAKAGIKIEQIRYGENKGDDVPYKPLTDEARADLQAMVNDVGAEFDGAMARGRGVSRKVVADSFGQGKVLRGKKIIAAGLADRMGTFSQVMGKLTKGRGMVAHDGLHIFGDAAVQDKAIASIFQSASALLAKVKDKAEMVDPEDGECPEGYEMQDDGMCHLMPAEGAKATASAVARPAGWPGPSPDAVLVPESEDGTAKAYREPSVEEQQAADNDALAVALALSE
jgi:signal peptide peptidase SppA